MSDYLELVNKLSKLKRVDFRWLDKQTNGEIRELFDHLYTSEKLSTTEIAGIFGKSQQFAWSMCRRLGITLRSRAEGGRIYAPKRTPNVRRPFDGTSLDRAYLQGFARGDLDVRKVSSLAIMVSTTTTHPAFVSLFESLFRPYGPVYVYPVYDEKSGYKWKLAARLDNSFDFMLPEENPPCPAYRSRAEFMAWLAGVIDSDGSVGLIHSGIYVRPNLEISNQDTNLLGQIRDSLTRLGYLVTGPYRSHPKGHETPAWHLKYNEDMHHLFLQKSKEVKQILRLLPLKHQEKRRRKELVLSLAVPALWKVEGVKVQSLRDQIDSEVANCIRLAESTYRALSHKKGRESATSRLSRAVNPHPTSLPHSTMPLHIWPCR